MKGAAVKSAGVLAPDDDGAVSPVLMRRVVESLTASDLSLLRKLEGAPGGKLDVEYLAALGFDGQQMLWAVHFGLCEIDVDLADRVYLARRPEGKMAIDAREGRASAPRKKRGRRPVAARL